MSVTDAEFSALVLADPEATPREKNLAERLEQHLITEQRLIQLLGKANGMIAIAEQMLRVAAKRLDDLENASGGES